MRNTKKQKRLYTNSRGFSLLEVLLGISVFMIGMLGVTALNISSMKSNTFSGNLSEATVIAAAKLEELMVQDFDDPAFLSDVDDDGNRLTDQDVDDDGLDDDDPGDTAADVDNKENFGLDDVGAADADYNETVTKNKITYNVYWNVAENEPVTVDPQRTKRITVIVEWFVKEEPRRISMSTIRQKE
jgi:type II secretory pathway pseudopilin PulG